jgi:protein tyrosine phosphatase
VHCSAGVGRTGTFIALYQIMEKLDHLVPEFEKGGIYSSLTVDIFNTAYKLRSKRVFMVQSAAQYKYLYESVSDYAKSIQKKNKPPPKEDVYVLGQDDYVLE